MGYGGNWSLVCWSTVYSGASNGGRNTGQAHREFRGRGWTTSVILISIENHTQPTFPPIHIKLWSVILQVCIN